MKILTVKSNNHDGDKDARVFVLNSSLCTKASV